MMKACAQDTAASYVGVMRARAFEPHILFVYAIKTAMHYHYASITQALACSGDDALPDAVRSFSRSIRRSAA